MSTRDTDISVIDIFIGVSGNIIIVSWCDVIRVQLPPRRRVIIFEIVSSQTPSGRCPWVKKKKKKKKEKEKKKYEKNKKFEAAMKIYTSFHSFDVRAR